MVETQSQEEPELGRTTAGSWDERDDGNNAKGGIAERICVEWPGWASRYVNLLLSMPMDIMFEVAGYLNLRDLVTLSCTSKELRGGLCSPNFAGIWKKARRGTGVPDCPPAFSEPQWAALLLGPYVCEQCGATGTHHYELYIQRRVCTRCKKKYLTSTIDFPELFPKFDAAILDMVPCTWTGGRPQKYRYNGKFFWGPDIERIGAEWALLQDDIQAHVEGAGERAAVYQEQRVREVRCITGYANRFHSWIHDLGVKALKKVIEKRMARFDGIRMRLLALGYDARDITYTAFHPPEFQEGSELTDKLWTHIQPRAVALVQSRRDARLEGERVRIRIWRITVLRDLYMEYAESVAPRQWCYLPDVHDLIEFPVFKSIVEDDSNISIPSSRFLRAAEQFPTVVQEWISAKKARITAMLGPPSGTADEPLGLAASVFECTSGTCFGTSHRSSRTGPQFPLISWEAIAAHSCQPTSQCLQMGHAPTSVGVSHLGRITAAALVREVGLDPVSATITQMDALDLRFTCLGCLSSEPGCRQMVGYPWRSAVKHGMKKEHTSWRRVSDDEAGRVRKEEDKWALAVQQSWSCSHCAHYLNDWRWKRDVIEHLRDVHGIASPTEPTDLFWHPGKDSTLSPYHLGSIENITEPTSLDEVNV